VWLEVPFDGSMADGDGERYDTGRTGSMHSLDEIIAFLARHPTAKIIIVIDTHCLSETGAFIWTGVNADTYRTCRMDEVCHITVGCSAPNLTCMQIILDCLPIQIRMFLTLNEKEACIHFHKTIILNLACGESISDAESRHSLFQG
jgi:hypothetical protein